MDHHIELLLSCRRACGTRAKSWVDLSTLGDRITIDCIPWYRHGVAAHELDWTTIELRQAATPARASAGREQAGGDHHLRVACPRHGTRHDIRIKGHRRILGVRVSILERRDG